MSELFGALSFFQWFMLGIGAFLIGPVLFSKLLDRYVHGKPEPPPLPGDESLTDVVECWENLKKLCKRHGLAEAEQEVHKVFPLFAKSKDIS